MYRLLINGTLFSIINKMSKDGCKIFTYKDYYNIGSFYVDLLSLENATRSISRWRIVAVANKINKSY